MFSASRPAADAVFIGGPPVPVVSRALFEAEDRATEESIAKAHQPQADLKFCELQQKRTDGAAGAVSRASVARTVAMVSTDLCANRHPASTGGDPGQTVACNQGRTRRRRNKMSRKVLLATAALIGVAFSGMSLADGLPPLAKKERYKVGFSQMESNNPWRIAETKSFHDTAAECGWDLIATDAAGSAAKQVADVDSMIAQGIDVLFLPPREEKPLIPAVKKAKAAGIPTFLVDRSVDPNAAKPGEDFVAFLGSDFIDQGKRVADWTIENFKGDKGVIVELEGTTGSSPANDRKKGFDDQIVTDPRFTIVASQSGDFARDLGRQVMETLLQAHPDVNIVYAHNDEMAIGAIQALELAGRKPGEDVLVVSIDGTRDALQAIIDGKMGVTVESSPFFGPLACATMKRYADGEQIEPWVQVKDRIFTKENAAENLAGAY
jgi:ribose transport system substrate-binding protein